MAAKRILVLLAAILALAAAGSGGALPAAEDSGDPLVDTVITLLGDKDKDLRAIALQQVREEAKGTAATQRFADLLPKLPPQSQAELIDALATRGDKTARPAILAMLKSSDEQVGVAAVRALGLLGEAADVPLLVQSLGVAAEAEKAAARQSLEQIRAAGVDDAIAQALKAVKTPQQQTALIQIVERRKTPAAVPLLLDLALSQPAEIRAASMRTLGQLAAAEDIPKMVEGLLKAERGAEREAAERAIMFVCERAEDADKRADPLLAAWGKLGDEQKTIVLPALGRVGGPKALKVVEEAMASANAPRREAGVRALCNWPEASVVDRLLKLAQSSTSANDRLWATRALPRVAVLRDSRSDAERLDLLKKIMALATRDEERKLVLDRAKAVRTIDSLRFVLPYLDQPALGQQACATVVELAHYRELRDPNKSEFDHALDRVISVCSDATLVDIAQRYQRGETVEAGLKKP